MHKFVIVVLLLAALPFGASARYYGGTHVSVGFGYGGGYAYPYYPTYPAYAYYPPYQPVYAGPPPVIVEEVEPYGTYARPAPGYDNGYCREFTRNVRINGRIEQGYGTACRQPDGSWQLVN